MKIKYLLFISLFLASTSIDFAQSKTKPTNPNVIIKNLYKAQEAGTGPFFQTKSRAVVDKYFVKDIADLIWKDAVESKGEVGKLEFDPLYGVQDPDVKNFVIQDTAWGGDSKFGVDGEASVQVAFKIAGEDHWVWFLFHQQKDAKQWKIYDVKYIMNGGEEYLKHILSPDASDKAKKADAWTTFEDKKLGVSFSYPADFEVAVGEGATTAAFSITLTPKKIPDKFRDSYEYRISKGDTSGGRCDSWEKETNDKPPSWPKTKSIGGMALNLYATAEGNMGGHTDITFGYSGTSKNGCLGIETSLRTGSAQMYGEKTYALDRKIIEATYLRLLDSFKFMGEK